MHTSYEALSDEQLRNPVRQSAYSVLEQAEHVTVNQDAVEELAAALADEYDFTLASWDAPVFPSLDNAPVKDVIDFIIVGNSINYCFNDLQTGEKYVYEYNGDEWRGAYGMWAALYQAYQRGLSVTDPGFLQHLDTGTVESLFRPAGDVELPMMRTRLAKLKQIGRVMASAGGSFARYFPGFIYAYGDDGVVDRLARTKAYQDEGRYKNARVRFDKRAQLAVSMLYGKLQDTTYEFTIEDSDSLTVFADYGIPAGLRAHGVLSYSDELASKVDERKRVQAWSPHEVEIRAGTVVAGDRIKNVLETEYEEDVTIPVLDHVLWQMRTEAESTQHLTETTAY